MSRVQTIANSPLALWHVGVESVKAGTKYNKKEQEGKNTGLDPIIGLDLTYRLFLYFSLSIFKYWLRTHEHFWQCTSASCVVKKGTVKA